MPVVINESQLLSGSAADAAALATLCYVGTNASEYLAYTTATLTGPGAYDLTVPQRGVYDTPVSAHSSPDTFVRVDDQLGRSGPLDRSFIGKLIWFKFTAFNIYGGAEESLAGATAYSYPVKGQFCRSDELVDDGNMSLFQDDAIKRAGSGAGWDAGFHTASTYVGGAALSFSPAQSDKGMQCGLSANTGLSPANVDYAFDMQNSAILQVVEAGALVAGPWTYVAGDRLRVVYEGTSVRYEQNGVVLHTTTGVAAGLALAGKGIFFNIWGRLRNVKYWPM
jgi:hypothetical protein